MRLENSGATTLGALLARLVDEATSRAGRSADLDLVLLASSGTTGIVAAALANGEKEVVVVSVLSDVGPFLGVLAVGLEGDVCAGAAAGFERGVCHADGKEVVPEGSEGHDEFAAVPVQRRVDGVVVLAGFGGDAGCAVVGPRVEVGAGGHADGGILHAEGGHGVVEVVGVADLGDIGGLV